MRNTENNVLVYIWRVGLLAAIGCMTTAAEQARAFPPEMRRGMIAGPWELVVRLGLEGPGLRHPIEIADYDKVQTFDDVLPVPGSPVSVRLVRYLPDMAVETTVVQDVRGDRVAELLIVGGASEQHIQLAVADLPRRSMTSRIGGVAIRSLHRAETGEALLKRMIDIQSPGTLTVRSNDPNTVECYVVKPGESIDTGHVAGNVRILRYLQHYSVDKETREIVNLSDKPINPAIEIELPGGRRKWLWSKFPASPHDADEAAPSMAFSDYDLGKQPGCHIIAAAPGRRAWLVSAEQGRRQVRPLELNKPYPFADEQYTFRVLSLHDRAEVLTSPRNRLEQLSNPALVSELVCADTTMPVVLQLGKPSHNKTQFGTVVLLYRQREPRSR